MLGVFANVRRWMGPSASGADEQDGQSVPDSSTFLPPADVAGAIRHVRPEVLRVILRMVLRDVRLRAGMDKRWIDLEVIDVAATAPDAARCLQARLVLKFWVPGLPACAEQLDRLFMERLLEIDPEPARWFRGLSWRLAPERGQHLTQLPSAWNLGVPGAGQARH